MTRRNDGNLPNWYERNIRPSVGKYVGLSGNSSNRALEGDLECFSPCQVCETCATSVLSMTDVDKLYHITYSPGKFTVNMKNKDVVFITVICASSNNNNNSKVILLGMAQCFNVVQVLQAHPFARLEICPPDYKLSCFEHVHPSNFCSILETSILQLTVLFLKLATVSW
jgi:hypothetical protein